MSPRSANQHAKKLAGLFPSLSPAQVIEWAGTFEKYDEQDVDPGMAEHYREATDGFVKPLRLIESIRKYRRRRESPPDDRRSEVEDEWALIDKVIEALPDPELVGLKATVIAEMPEKIRPWLERMNPRVSRTLKGRIFEKTCLNRGGDLTSLLERATGDVPG